MSWEIMGIKGDIRNIMENVAGMKDKLALLQWQLGLIIAAITGVGSQRNEIFSPPSYVLPV